VVGIEYNDLYFACVIYTGQIINLCAKLSCIPYAWRQTTMPV